MVDTNRAAVPIYNYLKSQGLDVTVVGNNPNETLAKYAEKYVKKLGAKNSIETFIIRLSEVHGDYQRASEKIKKLILQKFVFEIPETPAWITFITILKEVIINILEKKENPGEYTLVCDDIYWSDLLNYFGRKVNTKPKYEIIKDIICGCSSDISSATDLASIQSSISIGLSLSVGVILPKTDCALFSPNALVITFLI